MQLAQSSDNKYATAVSMTMIGSIYYSQLNYDKALEAFAKANINDPYVMYHKALALELKGDREAAKKTYEEVVNWNWIGLTYVFVRNKAKQKVQMSLGSN